MAKDDVFKTMEGDKMLLDPNDPKYRKPRVKQPIELPKISPKVSKLRKGSVKAMKQLRPIAGFLVAPYLIVRPIIRMLAKLGNWFFDKVFNPKPVK